MRLIDANELLEFIYEGTGGSPRSEWERGFFDACECVVDYVKNMGAVDVGELIISAYNRVKESE